MKIKSVSVDTSLLSKMVTEHAQKLGILANNEVLKLDFIEVTDPKIGAIFKKEKV